MSAIVLYMLAMPAAVSASDPSIVRRLSLTALRPIVSLTPRQIASAMQTSPS